MQATDHELDILRLLQEADRDAALASRELEALPQRKAILALRQQKAQILDKKVQVQDLLDTCEERLAALADEDSKLAEKQQASESELQGSTGDFRSVEARSKELNGIVKRRRTVSDELEQVEQRADKIRPVMAQVLAALDQVEAKEKALIASFQDQGSALQGRVVQGKAAHERLSAELSSELSKAYEDALARCGGVALAYLLDGKCSACRASLDQSHLSRIKVQAPVAICPACRRLLVVTD